MATVGYHLVSHWLASIIGSGFCQAFIHTQILQLTLVGAGQWQRSTITDGIGVGRRRAWIISPFRTWRSSEKLIGIFRPWSPGFVWVWPQRSEAGRGCDGDAAPPNIQTVDLRSDGHLGEEGVTPGHPGQGASTAALAALQVFNNVEDLLPLRLTSHSTDVQNGWHMLLPEHKGAIETVPF